MGRIRGEKSATEFSSNTSVHVVRSDSSEGIDNAPFPILDSQDEATSLRYRVFSSQSKPN